MAKKPVKTLHILDVARSLTEQNDALTSFLLEVYTAASRAENMGGEACRQALRDLAEKSAKLHRCFWLTNNDDEI